MARMVLLNAVQAGITRLRTKGGASPNSLYDLVNGYVTASRTIKSRPGSREVYTLPVGTKGLCAFKGKLHVFSADVVTPTNPLFVAHTLRHPDPAQSALALKEIHFAAPFLGYLYVVAEFANGDVFHYWLQESANWQANTIYREGDVVQPTLPNGYAYRAARIDAPAPVWAPNVARAIGDKVEPTTANGFQFTVIDTLGASPKSGATEPDWPAEDGATVAEDTDLGTPTPPSLPGSSGTTVPGSVVDRYGNRQVGGVLR